MALRRDYSLTKDIDFIKSRDIYALSNDYESVKVPGRNSKRVMQYLLRIYRGCCGEGSEIEKIYDVYDSYSTIEATDLDYMFVSEAELLKNMYTLVNEYNTELDNLNDQLGRKIDSWLATINPKMLNPEQKQRDVQFVGQVELILNRRVFIHEIKEYMDSLMKGTLKDPGYPSEIPDPNSTAVSLELPVMTHVPQEEDISEDDLSSNNLFQVLYNIVAQDSYVIVNMFRDYDNGNVCLRLWKKENDKFVPQFFSINKSDVYLEKIGYLNQKAIWPGLIEAAVKQLDLPGDKLSFAEVILGPEYVNYELGYLIGPNEAPTEEDFEKFNNLVEAYVKCTFDVYSAMLLTNSLVIADEAIYVKLLFGIKELIYSLIACLSLSLDLANDAVNMVKQLILDYQEDVQNRDLLSDPVVRKRLSICDTMKDVLRMLESDEAYHNNPRGYFALTLAEKIAESLLRSSNQDASGETLKEKTKEVLADKAFKRQVSKINIHNLKHSTSKMADAVLSAMESR